MTGQRTLAALAFVALLAPRAGAEEIVKRVGRVTFRVDASRAFPGGVVAVRLDGRATVGSAWALLEGRRAPFYRDHGKTRALVPVALTAEPGPATLGVGIAARRGEQRIVIPIEIAARLYRPGSVSLPEEKRGLLDLPGAARDARRLLGLVRTESKTPAPGLLLAPVGTTGEGFGEPRTYAGLADVERHTDGLLGAQHRGLDYAVATGTPVRAPAAGIVLLAGPLTLSGHTVVIDHGQGVVSVLEHLSRVEVREGDAVAAGAVVALSGDTGMAPEPLLQWRVYLHGVPVDPGVLGSLL
jgi:murein DD-endopeptidase MepM/ murein hydrolase activator NlpD